MPPLPLSLVVLFVLTCACVPVFACLRLRWAAGAWPVARSAVDPAAPLIEEGLRGCVKEVPKAFSVQQSNNLDDSMINDQRLNALL